MATALVSVTPLQEIEAAPVDDHKFLAIGADDLATWGDDVPVWPDLATRQRMADQGFVVEGKYGNNTNPTISDLNGLYEVIDGLNEGVNFSHQVVLTPFWITGGPDYEAMNELGCPSGPDCEYVHINWTDGPGGLAKEPYDRGDLRPAFWRGFQEGYLHPEYHGRQHFNRQEWLQFMEDEDDWTLAFFEENLIGRNYSIIDPETLKPHWVWNEHGNATDSPFIYGYNYLYDWLSTGLQEFEDFWGYESKIGLPPFYGGAPTLPYVYENLGIIGMDCTSFSYHNETGVLTGVSVSIANLSTVSRSTIDGYCAGGIGCVNLTARHSSLSSRFSSSNFLALNWHGNNWFTSTYNDSYHWYIIDQFNQTIEWLRDTYPELIIVTSHELHQIKTKGWSREHWHDHWTYRNYNGYTVNVTLTDLGTVYNGADWENDYVIWYRDLAQPNRWTQVPLGSKLALESGHVYEAYGKEILEPAPSNNGGSASSGYVELPGAGSGIPEGSRFFGFALASVIAVVAVGYLTITESGRLVLAQLTRRRP